MHQVKPSRRDLLPRGTHVIDDAWVVKALCEIVCVIIGALNLYNSDVTLRHAVLHPELISLWVAYIANASPRRNANRCVGRCVDLHG